MIHDNIKIDYNLKKERTSAAKKNKKKTAVKKTQTNKIQKSIDAIAEGKLSNMGLFELSIESIMPTEVFRELKRRIELIRTLLKKKNFKQALEVVDDLLKSPQKTRR